jgi:hypothetical protein
VRSRTTITLLGLAAVMAAGCGADEEKGSPIPAAAAAELEKRLDSVQGRFNFGGGACADIPEDQQLVAETIAQLPDDVDPDVRQALQEGFDRLFTLTDEQCDETKGQETETEPETEPEPLPEPDPETETETVPTLPDTETETVPTLPEEPPIEPVPPEEDPSGEKDGSGGAAIPEGDG